ncbi:MAG TPA: hypothetical protein VGX25_21155 [Actinophytocola sp.]|uniref:hypothetical protein n=1 Tax=Actinophytocola sp. TaxID=1872138 RepID=UPI002DDD4A8E|nr:hypothetical protein [Actinophytocola sp.]HEV2781904.1 hypothetical protein [Actinophytocola sp.]
MEPERPRPPEDPYRAVWHMTPVGGPEGKPRRTELKIMAGLIAALVVFLPFAVLAGVLWGWWWSDGGSTTAGWVVTLLGLAGAFSMGAFVASDRS